MIERNQRWPQSLKWGSLEQKSNQEKSGKPSRTSLGKKIDKLPIGYPGENIHYSRTGFSGGSVVKNPPANAGDKSLILWWRKWQPTPVLLPSESHGQRSLVGYSPRFHKRIGHDLVTKKQQFIWGPNLQDILHFLNNLFGAGRFQINLFWISLMSELSKKSPSKVALFQNLSRVCHQ